MSLMIVLQQRLANESTLTVFIFALQWFKKQIAEKQHIQLPANVDIHQICFGVYIWKSENEVETRKSIVNLSTIR